MLNHYEIQKYIQATADRADLTVIWTDDGTPPRTNGTEVYLPELSGFSSQEEAVHLMHFVAHEVSHIIYSDFKLLSKELKVDMGKTLTGMSHGLLEDNRVDSLNGNEFEGDRLRGDFTTTAYLNRSIDNLKKFDTKILPEKEFKETEKIATMLTWCMEQSKHYPSVMGSAEEIDKTARAKMTDDFSTYMDRLHTGPYGALLDDLKREYIPEIASKKLNDLVKKIFKEVFKIDYEEQLEKDREKTKQIRGKERGEGKTDEENGEGNNEGGDKSKYGEKRNKVREKFVVVDYEQLQPSPSHVLDAPKVGMKLVYKKEYFIRGGNYTPTKINLMGVLGFEHEKIIILGGHGANVESVVRHISTRYGENSGYVKETKYLASKNSSTEGFANKVRMKIQIRSKNQVVYGTKQGLLHKANINRVILKDAHEYSQKIFKQTIVSETLNTAVLVLVDNSGSMSGEKFTHAIYGAMLLQHTLGNILHIPCEVESFTDYTATNEGIHTRANLMYIWRKFDDKLLNNDIFLRRANMCGQYMAGNADGEALLFAFNRIKVRKEKRKIIIVLSDGSPAGGAGGNITGYTKYIASEIEASRFVDLYAIGIMDRNVAHIYKHFEVINKSSELEPAMLKVIERKII